MAYNQVTAELLTGKKVIVTYNLEVPNEHGETAVEVEGTILAAAEVGVMLRPRANQQPVMVHNHQIEDIVAVVNTKKDITAKALKGVTLDDVRQHLADRHAFALISGMPAPLATGGETRISVNEISAVQALQMHDQLDHSFLGHSHRES